MKNQLISRRSIEKLIMSITPAKSGVVERAAEIIRRQFDAAIADKEEELEAVHKAMVETQEVLRLLRYAAVTKAFSKSACNDVVIIDF